MLPLVQRSKQYGKRHIRMRTHNATSRGEIRQKEGNINSKVRGRGGRGGKRGKEKEEDVSRRERGGGASGKEWIR